MAHKLSISIFRIHRDLASRIDGARDDILQQFDVLRLEILGLRTGSSNTLTSSSRARAGPFDIPISLEGLFEQQIQDFDIDKSQFPLVRGLDAAVYHINAANTIPADNKESKRERQWLEIAKAFWIINRVRAGKEYVLSACYILLRLAVELHLGELHEMSRVARENSIRVVFDFPVPTSFACTQALIILLPAGIFLHVLFDHPTY